MTVLTSPVGQMSSWGLQYLLLNKQGEAIAAFTLKADLDRFIKELRG